MAKTNKELQNQLGSDIRRSQNEASFAIKKLLGLLIDEAKDNLVNATGAQTLKLQGEAQALTRLHKLLTQEPPSIKRKQGDV